MPPYAQEGLYITLDFIGVVTIIQNGSHFESWLKTQVWFAVSVSVGLLEVMCYQMNDLSDARTSYHSFPRQISPNSVGQFAKFRSIPQQIFYI